MSSDLRKKRRTVLPIYTKIPACLVFILCFVALLTLLLGIYSNLHGIPFSGQIVGFSFNAKDASFIVLTVIAAYTFASTLMLFTGLSQTLYWHLGGLAAIEASSFTLLLHKDTMNFGIWQLLILPQVLGLLLTHKKWQELGNESAPQL